MKVTINVLSPFHHSVTAGECRADIHQTDDGPLIVWRTGFCSATLEELEAVCKAAKEMI